MVTRYNPRCLVTVDGQLIATGGTGGLLAVDKLSVRWGRSRVWDHQESAQATFSLLDAAAVYGAHTGPTLLNKTVLLSYDVPGVLAERVFFRGKVTDVTVTVLPPDPATGANRGIRLDCTAVSVVTTVASVRTGAVSYGTELFNTRWSRLRNFIWPSLVSSAPYNTAASDAYGNTLNWGNQPLAARTYDNVPVIDALRELLDHTADRMVYDPHTNALGYSARKVIDSSAGFALLTADAANDTGRVLKLPGNTAVPMLRGGEFTSGGLQRSTETTLTAVQATRYTDSTGATASDGTLLTIDAAADATSPNRMVVGTDYYQGASSSLTAIIWTAVMQQEAKRWIPEPVTHLTRRSGGMTVDLVPLLLSGAEPAGFVYLGGTDWARAGAVPAWSIIGGTIDYGGDTPGWWSPTVQLAGVHFRHSSASTANARTPANLGTATPALTPAGLSPSVSAADGWFWTTPYTG